MTAFTSKVGFPNIPLTAGMQIVLEAVDPTTGAAVGGVSSSRWSIYGETGGGSLKLEDVVPPYTADDSADLAG